MKVAAVVSDLMLYSRIEAVAEAAGAELVRVDDPTRLPADAELVLVDWSARRADWTDALVAHVGRVIVVGPHTDLDAHAAASAAGLGPMWGRSKLLRQLVRLLSAPAGSRSPRPTPNLPQKGT